MMRYTMLSGRRNTRESHKTNIQKRSIPLASYNDYPEKANPCFLGDHSQKFSDFPKECSEAEGKRVVFLWGDSFSSHYLAGLKSYLSSKPVKIVEFSTSTCPPALNINIGAAPNCGQINQSVVNVLKMIKPEALILSANWSSHASNVDLLPGLAKAIREAHNAGVQRIIVLGQTPVWEAPLYKILGRHFAAEGKPLPVHTSIGLLDLKAVDQTMSSFARSQGAAYVEFLDQLCDSSGCLTQVGNKLESDLITFDVGHLTTAASIYLVQAYVGPTLHL